MLNREDRAILGGTREFIEKLKANPGLDEFGGAELDLLLAFENMQNKSTPNELKNLAASVDITPEGLELLEKAREKAREKGVLDVPINIHGEDEDNI